MYKTRPSPAGRALRRFTPRYTFGMAGAPALTIDIDVNGPAASYFHRARPSISSTASSRPGSSSSVATISSLASQASDGSGPSRPRRLPPSPADSARRVRPLPSLPATSPTCPCSSPSYLDVTPQPAPPRPRSLRPLPSLPELSVTRPPTPAPTRSASDDGYGVQVSSGEMTMLSVDTSSLRLAPLSPESDETSPISPYIPEPPTPATAHRRRMSKLRRHLGERPPSILVPAVPPLPPLPEKAHILGALSNVRDPVSLADAIDTAHRVLEIEFDSTSDDEYTESDAEDDTLKPIACAEEPADAVTQRFGTPPRPPHKYSKKWLRERRGRQRETLPYQEVLNALRVL
ncbi:uncharacterized protein SCHCODRAFT_02629029 [Schizophyllum commune H4-8]|uniref:uncharacterized protein n=1 Tax=Schizophyllum commune (strain H4-8 / FGSC 9210) TaxID=578458 RepID=UPI00215E804A|nr:uncharacterized protein SCHCODRAFT_02629029 [Schizophyllum commune H4-8]KAI5891418.1 hypothetical protein SCHCODRAFT_02629029 [Schizophyllum commune H4-8]